MGDVKTALGVFFFFSFLLMASLPGVPFRGAGQKMLMFRDVSPGASGSSWAAHQPPIRTCAQRHSYILTVR